MFHTAKQCQDLDASSGARSKPNEGEQKSVLTLGIVGPRVLCLAFHFSLDASLVVFVWSALGRAPAWFLLLLVILVFFPSPCRRLGCCSSFAPAGDDDENSQNPIDTNTRPRKSCTNQETRQLSRRHRIRKPAGRSASPVHLLCREAL